MSSRTVKRLWRANRWVKRGCLGLPEAGVWCSRKGSGVISSCRLLDWSLSNLSRIFRASSD